MTDPWPPALDALEEWVRRASAALRTRELALPDSPPPLPTAPLPEHLRVRALTLLAALQDTEAAGAAKRAQLHQQQAYGSA